MTGGPGLREAYARREATAAVLFAEQNDSNWMNEKAAHTSGACELLFIAEHWH